MQIFVNTKGERRGPFSLYQVSDQLTEGALSPDDLGWHQGRDEWTPLREIPALMSTIEAKRERDFLRESSKPLDTTASPDKASKEGDRAVEPSAPRSANELRRAAAAAVSESSAGSAGKRSRPFTRFWARIFDHLLVVLAVYLLFGMPPMPGGNGAPSFSELMTPEFWQQMEQLMEQPEGRRLARIQSAALVIWAILEGLLLARFGATPGKALFAIRVTRPNGGRISLQQGILRSLFVWFAGVGMWLPPVALATMTFGLYYLLSRGTTLWDAQVGTRVQQQRLGPLRLLLVIGAFLAILLAQQALTLR